MTKQEIQAKMIEHMQFPKKLYERAKIEKRENGTFWARLAASIRTTEMARVPEGCVKDLLRNRQELIKWFRSNLKAINKNPLPLFMTPPEGHFGQVVANLSNFRIAVMAAHCELHCDVTPCSPFWNDEMVGANVAVSLHHDSKTVSRWFKEDVKQINGFFLTTGLNIEREIETNYAAIAASIDKRKKFLVQAEVRKRANNKASRKQNILSAV